MVRAGKKSFSAPERISYKSSVFPQSCGIDLCEYDEQFHVVTRTNQPIVNARYRITSSSGKVFEGITDVLGYTERIKTHDAVDLTIEILEIEVHGEVIGDLN